MDLQVLLLLLRQKLYYGLMVAIISRVSYNSASTYKHDPPCSGHHHSLQPPPPYLHTAEQQLGPDWKLMKDGQKDGKLYETPMRHA